MWPLRKGIMLPEESTLDQWKLLGPYKSYQVQLVYMAMVVYRTTCKSLHNTQGTPSKIDRETCHKKFVVTLMAPYIVPPWYHPIFWDILHASPYWRASPQDVKRDFMLAQCLSKYLIAQNWKLIESVPYQ